MEGKFAINTFQSMFYFDHFKTMKNHSFLFEVVSLLLLENDYFKFDQCHNTSGHEANDRVDK